MSPEFERLRAANANIPHIREQLGEYLEQLKELVQNAHMLINAREVFYDHIHAGSASENEKGAQLEELTAYFARLVNVATEAEKVRLEAEAERNNEKKRAHVIAASSELIALINYLDERYGDVFPPLMVGPK